MKRGQPQHLEEEQFLFYESKAKDWDCDDDSNLSEGHLILLMTSHRRPMEDQAEYFVVKIKSYEGLKRKFPHGYGNCMVFRAI
jgi:hypothetical protein